VKPIHKLTLLLALALGLGAGSASATSFTYSYTFGDGQVVSGSLDGTQSGNFIEGVSNVSVFFDGIALLDPVFTAKYDEASSSYLTGAVVSFDALQNNFFFVNSDLAAGDFGFDSIFYMANAADFGGATAVAFSTLGFASQDSPTVSGSWSLTAVPEGGATIAFLGMAMVGLAWVRRQQSLALRQP
jgi:hypothetical protein